MTSSAPPQPSAHAHAVTPREPVSQAAEAARFFRIAVPFLLGFVLASLLLDGAIGAYLRWTDHRGGLGGEVQTALERCDTKRGAVRAVFLGDSVAHQLFHPGAEPGPRPATAVRFLTTNQAVTVAGQCYLAEGAIRKCPNLADVYIFYLPMAWQNDMPREYTHDYFCGHFHTAAEVAEVFRVKRDVELSCAHAGRWMWPNIMAANSLSAPTFVFAPAKQIVAGAAPSPPPDPEKLLTELSAAMAPPPPPVPSTAPGDTPVILSATSKYYLDKLRAECRSHGVRLHVLPCPVSREKNHMHIVDPDHIYDGEMIQDIPADELIDPVHFKIDHGAPFVKAARQRLIRMYNLPLPLENEVGRPAP